MQTKGKIILVVVLLVLAIGLFSLISSILAPPKADLLNDVVFEKIGGDDFLNVTIKYCLKIDEKDIPDGSFSTNEGELRYYNAKNITYVDTSGIQDYFIIWKADCDKYDWVDTNQSVNQYASCYLTGDVEGKCFVEKLGQPCGKFTAFGNDADTAGAKAIAVEQNTETLGNGAAALLRKGPTDLGLYITGKRNSHVGPPLK